MADVQLADAGKSGNRLHVEIIERMTGVNREANAYAKGLVETDALKVVLNVLTYALSQ